MERRRVIRRKFRKFREKKSFWNLTKRTSLEMKSKDSK
jgi:hypothetical protein